jgi:dTMP kinase
VLIVIEGIDGSGKGTQAKALTDRLIGEGRKVMLFQFPQYADSFFGHEVGRYLNGDFGTIETVPVKFASLLYSLDRFEARDKIISLLEDGYDVICDRYTGSNLAHQLARVPESEKQELLKWILHVEQEILKIPKPDVVIFLDIEVKISQALVSKKTKRNYTEKTHDLHEASQGHLEDALLNFRKLAAISNWKKVNCLNEDGTIKSPSLISQEIFANVDSARKQ